MSDEKVYSQAELDQSLTDAKNQWLNDEFNPLKSEVESLRTKVPKELSDDEKAQQQKELDLFNREKNLTLREAGLGDFADFFHVEKVEDLDGKIKAFNQILKNKKLDNSFKPSDTKHTDKYSKYEKEKNVSGMLSEKLGSLFK
jgi:molecular chaperone GrpE